MSASAIYEGRIRHRRHTPVAHEFEYRIFMPYIDLAELPELFDGRWLWSARRPALAWLRRADYLGGEGASLEASVRDLVEARTGRRPAGPVRMLANLRTLGYLFNPVSFYYCMEPDGGRLAAVVAEVTNTPWGDRHAYVLERAAQRGPVLRARVGKQLHVSPFNAMDQEYEWSVSEPGKRLLVHIENRRKGRPLTEATLSLVRREANAANLRRVLLRYPLLPLGVSARIYANALRLRLKGAPWHSRPDE